MKISKNGLEEMWLTFADRLLKGEMKAQGNQVNFEIDPTVLICFNTELVALIAAALLAAALLAAALLAAEIISFYRAHLRRLSCICEAIHGTFDFQWEV